MDSSLPELTPVILIGVASLLPPIFTDTFIGVVIPGVVSLSVPPFPLLLLLVCLLVAVNGASLFVLEVLEEVLLRFALFFHLMALLPLKHLKKPGL